MTVDRGDLRLARWRHGIALHPRGRSRAAGEGGNPQAREREANIYSRTFGSGAGRSTKRPILDKFAKRQNGELTAKEQGSHGRFQEPGKPQPGVQYFMHYWSAFQARGVSLRNTDFFISRYSLPVQFGRDLQPSGYERAVVFEKRSIYGPFRVSSHTSVHVCSRRFIGQSLVRTVA